jgi:hypothetical protein
LGVNITAEIWRFYLWHEPYEDFCRDLLRTVSEIVRDTNQVSDRNLVCESRVICETVLIVTGSLRTKKRAGQVPALFFLHWVSGRF